MMRSFDSISGSPGHTFETKKEADGTYTVTTPSIEGQKWTGDTEREAIQVATKAVYDMACRGEIGSA